MSDQRVATPTATEGGAAAPPMTRKSTSSTLESNSADGEQHLRDEMAAMAWAVEKNLQGPMDGPVNGYEAWRLGLIDHRIPPRTPTPGGPDIYYRLETPVPDNWIAMVPVLAPDGGLYYRRGIVERPAAAGPPIPILARGVVLETGDPFFVTDQAIPRAGADVSRRFRRARWSDWLDARLDGAAGSARTRLGLVGIGVRADRKVWRRPPEIEP
jgi:hypothetical protein